MAKGSGKKRARTKPEVVSQVRNSLEWLPHGWILEIKTQLNGERVGRKFKCYFDPHSASRFYSKAEVLRFLKSGNVSTSTSREKRHVRASVTANVLAHIEYSPDGLPYGWIKEIKFSKSNSKGIRADPYYTDPVSGYVFRSLKDATHYVETGEIAKHARGPRKISVLDLYSLEKESHPPIPVKKLKLPRSSTSRCPFTEGAFTSNGEVTAEIDASPDKSMLPPPDHASSESFQKVNKNKRKVLETANGEQKSKKGRPTIKMSKEIDKLSDKLKLQAPDHASSKSCQNVESISSPPIEGSEGKAVKKRKRALKAATDNSMGTDNYPEQKAKRETLPKTRFHSEKEKTGSEELREPSTVIVATQPNCQGRKQQRAIKNKLAITLPRRLSKRLAGLEPAPVTDLVIHHSSHHSMSNGGYNGRKELVPLADSKMMDTEEKASLGEQMLSKGQTLESSSPLASLPVGEICPAPCMEFAVKKRENVLRAATNNSLDTSSRQEQKARRETLPKTRFRSGKKKRSEELRESSAMIMKVPPVSRDKKQQGAIKNKSITTCPRLSSNRLPGLEPAHVTDLVILRPSSRPMFDGVRDEIKESVHITEPKRVDTEEKASLGELVLLKRQTLKSSYPLVSSSSNELWPDPCTEFSIEKKENGYREKKAKRSSLPKTRFRTETEIKELPGTPTPIEKLSKPTTNEITEKKQRGIKGKSGTTLPRRSSKTLACPSSRSTSNSECRGIKESVHSAEPERMNSKEKSLGEQVLLKGQMSVGRSSSSPLVSLPFGELWQDPCIEFAVKTLIGEIPVPDEGIMIEKYVQKQLGSSVETGKLNPTASAVAATANIVRSNGSVELLPENKHLLVPNSDEGKSCPSENGLALDAMGIQKVMQKFKRLGL